MTFARVFVIKSQVKSTVDQKASVGELSLVRAKRIWHALAESFVAYL